jgi:hypothetical protein
VNNYKLDKMKKNRMMLHFVWVFLSYLAFTFDVVFKSGLGVLLFILAVGFNIAIDLLRKRYKNPVLEISALAFYIVLSLVSTSMFLTSFISPEFSWYLVGMILATVGVTYFIRRFKIIDPVKSDSVGISERLALFIFVFAQKIEFVIITVVVALLYRLIFSLIFSRKNKKEWVADNKKEWVISPVTGLIVSYVWFFIMRMIF